MLQGEEARDLLRSLSPVEAAPRLLGARLRRQDADGAVELRIVEVEAYAGSDDPGSHGYRGMTPRTEVMFGDAGHFYAYFTYGMHTCGNVVVGQAGESAAVLLRGAEVIAGAELAASRRSANRRASSKPMRESEIAAGPANLVKALGASLTDNGVDLLRREFLQAEDEDASPKLSLALLDDEAHAQIVPLIRRSLRTGVSGPGGLPPFEWRFWLEGKPGVSRYKPHPAHRDSATWYG